jgi:hypothetical protein
MNSVGRSKRSAMPIQKSEKRSAVMSERERMPRMKETKSRRGVRERDSWIARKDCFYACN